MSSEDNNILDKLSKNCSIVARPQSNHGILLLSPASMQSQATRTCLSENVDKMEMEVFDNASNVCLRPGAKTIKKNTNSTQNKSQTHHAKQYEITSFLSTDCDLSTETCSKNVYSLGPWYTFQLHRMKTTSLTNSKTLPNCSIQANTFFCTVVHGVLSTSRYTGR